MLRRRLKKAPIIALAAGSVLLILSACSGDGAVAAQAKSFRVERGDITLKVTAPGNLSFANKTRLSFGREGLIRRVFVSEGVHIKAGQPIAELNSEALLQSALRAEFAVDEARALLNEVSRIEPRAIVDAQAEVVAAKQALIEANEALSAGFLEVLQRQQQKVAKLALAVKQSEAALEKVEHPFSTLEISVQTQAVTEQTLKLQQAQDALVLATSPFTIQVLRRQELAVAEARAAVENAKQALALAREPVSEEALASAAAAANMSEDLVAAARDNLDAIKKVQSTLVRNAEESLEKAEQSYRSAITSFLAADAGSTNRPSVGIEVTQQDILLDPSELAKKYEIAGEPEVVVSEAWTDLTAARNDLNLAQATQALDLTKALKEIIAAEGQLATASNNLSKVSAEPDSFNVAVKEAALEAATGDLIEENRLLAEIFEGGDRLEIAAAAAAVQVARARLEDTQDQLTLMTEPPSQTEINFHVAEVALAKLTHQIEERIFKTLEDEGEARQSEVRRVNVAVAEARLEEALAVVDQLEEGVDPLVLAQHTNRLAEAEVALANVNNKLEEATLLAPRDGLVLELNVSEGDPVVGTTIVAVTTDPQELVVTALVDEIDVLRVRELQPVQISLDSAPELAISGSVRKISLTSNQRDGIVRYLVTIDIDRGANPRALEGVLREGLSTRIDILLEKQTGVLTVPVGAVELTTAGRVVQVIRDDRVTETRTVELGITDGTRVVVTTGIAEGETILVPKPSKNLGIGDLRLPTDNSGF